MRETDLTYLRAAFAVAERARQAGDHPFGAVLVGPDDRILLEQGNGFTACGHDMTAHAERVLATRASKLYRPAFLADCTMYVSAEPCAMCAGAIYWSGIGRVVYGQSEASLKAMTGNHDENPTLDLPCRQVFAAGQRPVEVIGPLLEDEAAALQNGFWTAPKLTLEALNTATPADFTGALGAVFEHSPWVAERAAAQRPFASLTALHEAMMEVVRTSDADTQLRFLAVHPELAGEAARRATLAAHSASEQASLGLDSTSGDLAARFDALNAAYRQRFGHPFIICVRRHTLPSLLAQFESRLRNTPETERATALSEIAHITRLRLSGLLDAPDAAEGWLTTHVLNAATGRPAAGMAIRLYELAGETRTLRAEAVTNDDGRTDAPLLPRGRLRIGTSELRFDVGAYFQHQDTPAFLDEVPIRFGVSEPETHYHVPLLVSPGAYSTYRGS